MSEQVKIPLNWDCSYRLPFTSSDSCSTAGAVVGFASRDWDIPDEGLSTVTISASRDVGLVVIEDLAASRAKVSAIGGAWFNNYLGWTVPSYTYANGTKKFTPCSGVEFITDSTKFDVAIQQFTDATPQCLVYVDGVPQPFIAGTTGDFGVKYILCDTGGARKRRTVKILFNGLAGFLSIGLLATCSVFPAKVRRKAVGIGDSIFQGQNCENDKWQLGFFPLCCEALGYNAVNCSLTNTGFLKAVENNFLQRCDVDIGPNHSDASLFVVLGGYNDYNANDHATFTIPQVVAQAQLVWSKLRSYSATALIVCGPPLGSYSDTYCDALGVALKAQFDSWADGKSLWFDGRVLDTAGNSAAYTTDQVHKNIAGNDWFARALFDAISPRI